MVYKRIKELYEISNSIAHGDLPTEALNAVAPTATIQRIAVQLKGVP